jgi:hypothetical protein
MASILLVNPAPLHGARNMAKRRRKHSMPAGLRRYWAGRKHNPSHRRHKHRYHRNPIGDATSMTMPVIKEGAMGAVGGLLADVGMGYINQSALIPASLAGPATTAAVKLLLGIVIGVVANKVKPGTGRALAVGAATVAIHDFAKMELQSAMPSLPLGAYMSYAPAVGTMGRLGNTSQGASVVRQLTRTTRGMGNIGAYLSRQGVKVPQRGMGAYMSGMGDTTFANGIPTG